MNAFEIIRAWKDEAFRASLTPAQLAALPANPAGMVEIDDAQLDKVVGGVPATLIISGCNGGTQSTITNTCNIQVCIRRTRACTKA